MKKLSPTLVFIIAALSAVAVMAAIQVKFFNAKERIGATEGEVASMQSRIVDLEGENRWLKATMGNLRPILDSAELTRHYRHPTMHDMPRGGWGFGRKWEYPRRSIPDPLVGSWLKQDGYIIWAGLEAGGPRGPGTSAIGKIKKGQKIILTTGGYFVQWRANYPSSESHAGSGATAYAVKIQQMKYETSNLPDDEVIPEDRAVHLYWSSALQESQPKTDKLLKAAVFFQYLRHKIRSGEPFTKELRTMRKLVGEYPAIVAALKPLTAEAKGGVRAFAALKEHKMRRHWQRRDGGDGNNAGSEKTGDDGGVEEKSLWMAAKRYFGSLIRFSDHGESQEEDKSEEESRQIFKAHWRNAQAVEKQIELVEDAIADAIPG